MGCELSWCVSVGSSAVAHVPLWLGLLLAGEAMRIVGRNVRNLWIFPLILQWIWNSFSERLFLKCLQKARERWVQSRERFRLSSLLCLGLCILWGSLGGRGKESVCRCKKRRGCGLDPWTRKDPLDEEKATHSSVLAWRILWGLARHSPWGSQMSWTQFSD